MKGKMPLLVLILTLFLNQACKQEFTTIAFYNVENLFDTLDNPNTNDSEFLPTSNKNWDTEKYYDKLDSLAKIISLIGDENGPEVIGLCEMENLAVLEDLVKRDAISDRNYQIAHMESNDYRGIDVALFYKREYTLDTMKSIGVQILDQPDFRTRDILHVQLSHKKLGVIHYFINHWPSRRGGQEESEFKRMVASVALRKEVEQVMKNDPKAQIVIMGDFNDEPTNMSLKNLEEAGLFNTVLFLDSMDKGTYRYRDNWNMLDQILVSPALIDQEGVDYVPKSATIFEKDWMKQKGERNRYAGYPLRTWGGRLYLGGFSDHFPVYIYLQD